jgi:hypothetical protein
LPGIQTPPPDRAVEPPKCSDFSRTTTSSPSRAAGTHDHDVDHGAGHDPPSRNIVAPVDPGNLEQVIDTDAGIAMV